MEGVHNAYQCIELDLDETVATPAVLGESCDIDRAALYWFQFKLVPPEGREILVIFSITFCQCYLERQSLFIFLMHEGEKGVYVF